MSALTYFTLDLQLEDDQLHVLGVIEHDGVEEYAIDEATVDELLGDKAFSGGDVDENTIALIEAQLGGGRYRLYFHGEQAKTRAHTAFKSLEGINIEATMIEHAEQDWNEEWRKGYTTVKISDGLWIIPSWERDQVIVPTEVRPLYLYPGQGFGTGRHETTSLCLELYEKHYRPGLKTVLDFGCGSGILGIAAELRDAAYVDYLDIDASALENTKQNLTENNLTIKEEQLILRQNFSPKKYSLVFANILLDILIKEKEAIVASLANDGLLIVSGLLNEHVTAFKQAYTDFKVIETLSKGDWSAIALERA